MKEHRHTGLRSRSVTDRAPVHTLLLVVLIAPGCLPGGGGGGDACEDEALPQLARAVLDAHCHQCHGQAGRGEAGFDYVLESDLLIDQDKVVPGDASASLLYQRLASGSMPPSTIAQRPDEGDVEIVKNWIDCGATPFDDRVAPEFVSPATTLEAMRDDIEQLAPARRRFTRYFVLTHLYNAGYSDDRLQSYRNGLSKQLNSLSWGSRVVAPVAIDPPRNTIYRIHLADYRWEMQPFDGPERDLWEVLLAAAPYGLLQEDDSNSRVLREATETTQPFVAADWFVFASSEPPLYHRLLRLPGDAKTLERALLGIDVASNIDNRLVQRAGFVDSGVSQHNRMFERHESVFGPYYKSYDFASSVDRQNILQNPLGPVLGSIEPFQFEHDGGELIFALPNGLHGYMLVNAAGTRIDAAPTTIVSDPRQADRAVRSGRSCTSCHVDGINLRDDEVLDYAMSNPGLFPPAERQRIIDIYPPRDVFRRVLQDDIATYLAARRETGMPDSITDPISTLSDAFLASVDLARAAAELFMSPDELRDAIATSDAVARELGSLPSGGTVKRETFREAFPVLACELDLGTPLFRGLELDCVAPECTVGSCCFGDSVQTSPSSGRITGFLGAGDALDGPRGSGHRHDDIEFAVEAGGTVTIEITSASFDTVLFLLDDECNVIAVDDDGGIGTLSRIELPLPANLPASQTYTVVVSTFFLGVTGSYVLEISQ